MWRWDQAEPFANNPADEDPDANSVAFDLPLRLPGQRYDQETGLHYNYFRDYDPTLGSFKQSDPIGIKGGLNTYAYAQHDPIRLIDGDGLKPYLFRIAVGGTTGWYALLVQNFTLTVDDPITGETCYYTVPCIGIGGAVKWMSGVTGGSPTVRWDDGKECSNCRQFEGYGMAGSFQFAVGGVGYSGVDWVDVPNGPRLDFSGYAPATISIGGGTFVCHFYL
ncbi:MAG: RHS repeat-associated core domain-containing protein [Gammaproteobacteria bacterium]